MKNTDKPVLPWVTTATRGRSTLDVLDTEADVYVAYDLEPGEALALCDRHNDALQAEAVKAADIAAQALAVKAELDLAVATLREVGFVLSTREPVGGEPVDGDELRERLLTALGPWARRPKQDAK